MDLDQVHGVVHGPHSMFCICPILSDSRTFHCFVETWIYSKLSSRCFPLPWTSNNARPISKLEASVALSLDSWSCHVLVLMGTWHFLDLLKGILLWFALNPNITVLTY